MNTADNTLIPLESHESTSLLSDSEVEFVEFEESETLDQPLYRAPIETSSIVHKDLPSVTFSREFQTALLETPALCRNIAIVGHLHHGKTSLVDMLVQNTHLCAPDLYTNTHYLETKREITISTKVMNLVAQNSSGKSFSLNLIDTPGHVDFWDQLRVGIDLCDSVLLVVDVCEPLMPTDYKAIEQALAKGKKITFCINKLDRLVIEQQRNLESATTRLYYVIKQLENALGSKIDPRGILFASSKYKWSFTLETIASLYKRFGDSTVTEQDLLEPSVFAKYALDPLFKIFYVVLSGDGTAISSLFDYLGIIKKSISSMDVDQILISTFAKYFETPASAIVDVIPPPRIIAHDEEELLLHIVTFIHHGTQLYALTKVLQGKIVPGQCVKSNGTEATISDILLPQAQYNSALKAASQGNIVLTRGIESLGCGFVGSVTSSGVAYATRSLSKPIIKVGVTSNDPERSSILYKNLELLKLTWPGVEILVEGTGEHFVCGPGELFLDCVLYALRHDFEELEIKVADPVTQFRETVLDDSYLMCTTETPNGLGKFSFLAEPLPAMSGEPHDLANVGWDQLTIDSIIDKVGPHNILVNESIDRPDGRPVHEDIIRGFREYLSSGPLCNEPVQCVAMKMSECELGGNQITGQVAPIVRRACLAAHMVATPRLLEPIYKVICLGPATAYKPLTKLLTNRRGNLTKPSIAIPGTTFHLFEGILPALDSAGFETELRGYCHDLIQVNLIFDFWRAIPGDPLDHNVSVRKLEKAGPDSLARDILIKLRKRKGLSREPDPPALIQ